VEATHVAARVGPPILAQLESLAGRRNELPQPEACEREYAMGLKALSTMGRSAISVGMPRFSPPRRCSRDRACCARPCASDIQAARVPALRRRRAGYRDRRSRSRCECAPEIVRRACQINRVRRLKVLRFPRPRDRRYGDNGRCRTGRGGRGAAAAWAGAATAAGGRATPRSTRAARRKRPAPQPGMTPHCWAISGRSP